MSDQVNDAYDVVVIGGGAAGLNGALCKLGMDADTSAKFVPTITDYLGKLGGDPTKKLLAKALQ